MYIYIYIYIYVYRRPSFPRASASPRTKSSRRPGRIGWRCSSNATCLINTASSVVCVFCRVEDRQKLKK